MEKRPFLTEEQAQEIIQDVPTPFHVYDEKGIRERFYWKWCQHIINGI